MASDFLVELVSGSFFCYLCLSNECRRLLQSRTSLCSLYCVGVVSFCLELSLLPRSDLEKVEIYFFKESSTERICHRILSESAIELA